MKEKGIETEESIKYEIDKMTFIYSKNNYNFDLRKNGNIYWNYNLNNYLHHCSEEIKKEECFDIIMNDINKYILN